MLSSCSLIEWSQLRFDIQVLMLISCRNLHQSRRGGYSIKCSNLQALSIYIQNVVIKHGKIWRFQIDSTDATSKNGRRVCHLRETWTLCDPETPNTGGCTGASTGAAFMASWLHRLYGERIHLGNPWRQNLETTWNFTSSNMVNFGTSFSGCKDFLSHWSCSEIKSLFFLCCGKR